MLTMFTKAVGRGGQIAYLLQSCSESASRLPQVVMNADIIYYWVCSEAVLHLKVPSVRSDSLKSNMTSQSILLLFYLISIYVPLGT